MKKNNKTAQLIGENKTELPFDGIPKIYEEKFTDFFGFSPFNYLTLEQSMNFFGKISKLFDMYQSGGHEDELIRVQTIGDDKGLYFGCDFIPVADLIKGGFDLKGRRKKANVFFIFVNKFPILRSSYLFGRLHPTSKPLLYDFVDRKALLDLLTNSLLDKVDKELQDWSIDA